MNPTTPKAHRITPGAVIPLPCWLWYTIDRRWIHFKHGALPDLRLYSHWHPDQPTAPTSIPSPVSSQDSEGAGERLQQVNEMNNEDLVELYQQICGRNSLWQTKEMHDRMFELRAEVLRRLAVPNQPAQEAAEWRHITHDSEIFLEFRAKGGPWVQAGIFFPQPGFTVKDFMQMVGHLRHFPAPSPAAVGEVREALQRVVDAYYSNKASMPTPIIEHCERALSKPSTPTQSRQ